jgi:hypothetical protein
VKEKWTVSQLQDMLEKFHEEQGEDTSAISVYWNGVDNVSDFDWEDLDEAYCDFCDEYINEEDDSAGWKLADYSWQKVTEQYWLPSGAYVVCPECYDLVERPKNDYEALEKLRDGA